MTEPTTNKAEEVALPPVVTLEEFEKADWQKAISNCDVVDCDALSDVFGKAANAATESGTRRALGLLASVCSFSFRPGDKASAYGPMFVMDGKRSAIPEDFRGEQTEVFSKLIPTIKHPGLRARIADTTWLNNRKDRTAAEAAVAAYCDAVEAVAAKELRHRFEPKGAISRRTLDYLERALTVSAATSKDRAIPDRLAKLVVSTVDACEAGQDVGAFRRAAGLAFRYDLINDAALGEQAEKLASTSIPDPLVRQELFQLAADAYRQAKNGDAEHRCRLEAAEMLVKMADGMSPASASAHWLMDAIRAFRTIPGTKERRKELEAKLREQQKDALDEMGTFSVPLDVEKLAKSVTEQMEGASLAEGLCIVASMSSPTSTADLKAEVLKQAEATPLSSMMSMSHIDGRDGKVTSVSPGAPLSGEPSEEWFEHQICRHEKLHRQIVIAGSFEPARRMISQSYSISERHFMPIVDASPFVPPGHEYIFALGFARLFQGDMVSAAHLLLPQLENSVRHVMRLRGGDPTMIQSDMVQEDRSLSALIETDRPTLEEIFGEALLGEIDRLFNSRAGPALRHDGAHGKFSAAHCFGVDAIYACWLIFSITCAPLFGEEWNDRVWAAIDAEAT